MKTENELIAEFMAAKKQYNDSQRAEYLLIAAPKGFAGNWYEAGNIRYHESWDWLMPVVDKIVSLSYDVHIHSFKNPAGVFSTITGIDTWNGTPIINKSEEKKIDSVYKAVIEFIKFFNSQNS